MRAPGFWSRTPPTLLARALSPLAAGYGAVAAKRLARSGETMPVPVVCVGNFTAGGAGKTPTALAIAEILASAGRSPAFLTRGYGGRAPGPLRVTPEADPAEVGDEPLLLARQAPTVLSRNRPAGARLAIGDGADVIVMDDGLQNPSLAKTLSLAVVDGAVGLGNGLVLPAGPLRAPIDAQWRLVDAVLVIGEGAAGEAVAQEASRRGMAVLTGRLVPDPEAAAALNNVRVLAVAGIGRPEKFFDTLRACGAIVAAPRPFPDHHTFSAAQIDALVQEARTQGLTLVTTEKDAARLRHPAFAALPVKLDAEGLRDLVLGRV